MKLREIEYNKIFKPNTIKNLDAKSKESVKQLLGDKNLIQTMMRSQQLIYDLAEVEKDYRDELEMIAVQICKEAYPIIEYAGIEIDAQIVDMGEIDLKNHGEGSIDEIPETFKRRVINGITQGASVRGAYAFMLFREYLDRIDNTLIEKYKEILNLSFGIFDNEEAVALMLSLLAQGNKVEGGSMEVEYDEDKNKLIIHARALNFPMLVHEIVKGLYEIVSLQGFGPDKEQNQNIVQQVDKLEHEPHDITYGKFIYDAINDLYIESNIDDSRIRELFLAELYKLDDSKFLEFIENLLNNTLTPSQKDWAIGEMKSIESDLKKDDTGLQDLDEIQGAAGRNLDKSDFDYKDLKKHDIITWTDILTGKRKRYHIADKLPNRVHIPELPNRGWNLTQYHQLYDYYIKNNIKPSLNDPEEILAIFKKFYYKEYIKLRRDQLAVELNKPLLDLKMGSYKISGDEIGDEFSWEEGKDKLQLRTQKNVDALIRKGFTPEKVYFGYTPRDRRSKGGVAKSSYVLGFYKNQPMAFVRKETHHPQAGQTWIYTPNDRRRFKSSLPNLEESQLLKEYSEKIYKTLIDRFKKQMPNLDEPIIRAYVERFDQLKNSIKQRIERGDETIIAAIPKDLKPKDAKDLRFLDILQWKKWNELERVIDIFPDPPSKQKEAAKIKNTADMDGEKVYDRDGIEVYKGDDRNRCIQYGHGMGNSYKWCISRLGVNNMYDNYRFQKGSSRMFYFVFDRNRTSRTKGQNNDFNHSDFTDPFHAIVIHVFENGSYGITNANNPGDTHVSTWDDLGDHIPKDLWAKIKPLKSLFKYQNPSEKEVTDAAIAGKDLTFEQFKLLSYENKLRVINSGKKLSLDMINILDSNLKSQYINMFQRMPFEAVATNLPLIKRYIKQQFDRKGNGINADYLPYMDSEQRKNYYEKFHNKPYLNYNHIEEFFPEEINKFLEWCLGDYFYMPDHWRKYMTPEQEDLYMSYIWAYMNSTIDEDEDSNELVKNYHVIPEKLSWENWNKIDDQYKTKFIKLIKELHQSGELDDHFTFTLAVPDRKIEGGDLYFQFEIDGKDQWVNVESIRESWDKFSLIYRAGIIK
jgi:hypothetical protein